MSQTTNVYVVKKKRLLPRLLQLVFIVVILVSIWFSFGQNVLAPIKQGSIPENFAGMELVSRVEGNEALSRISRLHGTDISLVSAYIASYAHRGEKATVWVGKAKDFSDASVLLTRMTEAIGRGGSEFGNLRKLNSGGQEYFQVDGPGGQHFFYIPRQSSEVVWLTVEGGDAAAILKQAIKVF